MTCPPRTALPRASLQTPDVGDPSALAMAWSPETPLVDPGTNLGDANLGQDNQDAIEEKRTP